MVAASGKMPAGEHKRFDYALIGGGLQNGLIALALLARRPGCSIALVERESRLGGNHTWCFHEADLPEGARSWVEPLVAHRWPGYDVRFPNLRRRIDATYAGFGGERLDAVVTGALGRAPGSVLLTGRACSSVSAHHVQLDDGARIEAEVVIDARGPAAATPRSRAGFQTFVGLEVELRRAHGLDRPLLMDATVKQLGAFRFVYILPFSATRLLIEDTYFCDVPELDREVVTERVRAYAVERGFDIDRIVRHEQGCLAMPWAGDDVDDAAPLRAGYGGGWFHPATGYSFPVAIRLAEVIASAPPGELFSGALTRLVREHRRQVAYCHRLNRMLFSWFQPEDRWNVFERFYRLPDSLIRRFYALETTTADRARILLGKPPRGLSLRARLSAARRVSP